MRAEDQFHIGIVVEDLEKTSQELSHLFGHQWLPAIGGPSAVTLPDGEKVLDLRCAYTAAEPRLEIIERIPGTLWEPVNGVHHIGYWSDDVAADAAALEDHGYVHEATRHDDGVPYFAFYRSPAGLRVELLSRTAQPGLERYWRNP